MQEPIITTITSRSTMPNYYMEDNADYVAQLGKQAQDLRNKMRQLRSDHRGKKSSKDELRRMYRWTETNLMFSDQVITFRKEYLFPQFKFLNKGWVKYDNRDYKSFSSFVKHHLPIRPDKEFANEWDQLIAPAIVKIHRY